MHSRASELLQALGMRPHPEGGHYAELYRSPRRVEVLERKVHRSAITSIYFLLAAGEYSRWHRVMSDEIWHYHEGDAVELLLFDEHGLRAIFILDYANPLYDDNRSPDTDEGRKAFARWAARRSWVSARSGLTISSKERLLGLRIEIHRCFA